MGKSPGKWIKTILFGKKHSSTNSKASAHYKTPASKTPTDDLSANSPVISGPCQVTDRGVEPLELDPVANQIVVDQESNNSSDAETMRQEQAATVAQAAFRGYLARRAFRALKGIIRLQALIRGHLVRRQAVATLRCMQAIVRLQAKARGQKTGRLLNEPIELKYVVLDLDASFFTSWADSSLKRSSAQLSYRDT